MTDQQDKTLDQILEDQEDGLSELLDQLQEESDLDQILDQLDQSPPWSN